ncbi:MAG: hypothetical protein IKW49_00955 [Opitutales bacterium]|nr:hypothetical protein [Opitutales bacterium]
MNSFKKGFTILETLIVVCLVAVVCAVAVPAVRQYKATQAQAIMQDDGARLGIAAQTYFAETFTHEVTLGYNATTGAISAPEGFKMLNGNRIAPGYDIGDSLTIERDNDKGFQLKSVDGGIYTFNYQGKLTKSKAYAGEAK